jgi:3-deoxy-manno-octulosonate cytidylyltransferase (CMP-KDO synthetase)
MDTTIVGIIPARYGSSRFPGKPLADIKGKSMIQRVFEQCLKAKYLNKVVIATDDERIAQHAQSFGAEVVMTNTNHPSGTDRCFEAVQQLDAKFDYAINIQGDEPCIFPEQIDELAMCLAQSKPELATLVKKVTQIDQLENPGFVMTVTDIYQNALYFSRYPIPFLKGIQVKDRILEFDYLDHVGIYGYRIDILEKICQLSPSKLELAEGLEQLRWLENGFKIKTQITKYESYPVDTLEDIARLPL